MQAEKTETGSNKNKDPRIGSKKPIPLTVAVAEQKLVAPTTQPKALLAKVKPVEIAPEIELEQIEQDERLAELLERTEQGEILTSKEAK